VRPFIASPGEEEIDDGQTSGADGEADTEAVTKVIEAHVAAAQGDLSFIDGKECTYGKFSDGVFEGAAKEQKVGSAEAVVGLPLLSEPPMVGEK
jgi:hypothetical protein